MIAGPQTVPECDVTHESFSADKEQVQQVPSLVGQAPPRRFPLHSPVVPADVPIFFGSTCRALDLLATATWEAGAVTEETCPQYLAGVKSLYVHS